ncbi:MAG: hypothetical protein PHX21_09210 [bacterium]|nr:hypothetical protein [bacterium]
MGIDKIKGIIDESKVSPSKSKNTDKGKATTDSNSVGGDINGTQKVIFESLDIREDKIAEVKERINQSFYDRDDVKKEAVENLLNIFNS